MSNLAHHILRNEWSEVLRVAKSHPHVVQRKDPKSRQFVLFMAIDRRAPTEVILQLLQAFPDAIKLANADDFGRRCIHLALEQRCSRSVILNILSTYPVDMQVFDLKQRKPIHYLRNFNYEHDFVGASLWFDVRALLSSRWMASGLVARLPRTHLLSWCVCVCLFVCLFVFALQPTLPLASWAATTYALPICARALMADGNVSSCDAA
jgi:hypothetical protein